MISLNVAMATVGAIALMARALYVYREMPMPIPLQSLCRGLGVCAALIAGLGLVMLSSQASNATLLLAATPA